MMTVLSLKADLPVEDRTLMEAAKVVTCRVCGCTSRDLACCEFCNADLIPVSPPSAPTTCPLSPEGPLYLSAQEAGLLSRPEASVTLYGEPKSWRLHWIPNEMWPEWKPLVEERLGCQALALPPCRVVEDLTGVWVIVETTGKRPETWKAASAEDPLDRLRHLAGVAGRGYSFWQENAAEKLQQLCSFLERLAEALESLQDSSFVWLTFHPHWLEDAGERLCFTNLDLSVHRTGRPPNRLRLVPSFAVPEVVRGQVADIGPRTSVYQLALFSYYWIGRYLPQGFPGKGLESFGFVMPPLRIFAPTLPPGIVSIVMAGLSLDSGRRPASPRIFCQEFRAAVDQVARRQASANPVHWDAGLHTRTGKAKAASGAPNQDYGSVRHFPDPDRTLIVVADGLSCCDVGSGDVASRLVAEAIGAAFGPEQRASDFQARIPQACRQGAEAILAWALEHGERERLINGSDLMATTVLAAWLEGNTLTLANAGDSRAYLINGCGIEQLTVDADLSCTLLAAGSPPENVVELGPVTRALRSCVGGVLYQSDTNELIVDEARCKLSLTRWKLLPDDVVILCSDGLVEEGAYLEPQELLELVRLHANLPAAELAEKLAEAADARQQAPSGEDPDGFGDNITACVIKIQAAG
jgi:protein phosphatase